MLPFLAGMMMGGGMPETVIDILTAGTTNYSTVGYTKADIQVISPGAGGAWVTSLAGSYSGGGAGGSHGWVIGLDISGESQLTAVLASPGASRTTNGNGNNASGTTRVTGAVLGNVVSISAAQGGRTSNALAQPGAVTILSGAGTSRGSALGGQGAEGIPSSAVGGGGGAAGRNGAGGDGSGQAAAASSGGGGGGARGTSGAGGGGGGVGLGPVGSTGGAQAGAGQGGNPGSGGTAGTSGSGFDDPGLGGAFGGGGGAGGGTGINRASGAGGPGAIRIRLYN